MTDDEAIDLNEEDENWVVDPDEEEEIAAIPDDDRMDFGDGSLLRGRR